MNCPEKVGQIMMCTFIKTGLIDFLMSALHQVLSNYIPSTCHWKHHMKHLTRDWFYTRIASCQHVSMKKCRFKTLSLSHRFAPEGRRFFSMILESVYRFYRIVAGCGRHIWRILHCFLLSSGEQTWRARKLPRQCTFRGVSAPNVNFQLPQVAWLLALIGHYTSKK